MVMPRRLAIGLAKWRKKMGHKKLKKVRVVKGPTRKPKRVYSMGKNKKKKGRGGKKGIIFGMGIMDIGQMAMTLGLMGVPKAARNAMDGNFEAAGNDIAKETTDNIVPIVINNMLFGFTRRIITRFAPKAIKRIL